MVNTAHPCFLLHIFFYLSICFTVRIGYCVFFYILFLSVHLFLLSELVIDHTNAGFVGLLLSVHLFHVILPVFLCNCCSIFLSVYVVLLLARQKRDSPFQIQSSSGTLVQRHYIMQTRNCFLFKITSVKAIENMFSF